MSKPRLPGPRRASEKISLLRGLAADPQRALRTMEQRFGPVVEFGWGRYRYVYLLSPAANEYILTTNPSNFTWKEAFRPLEVVNGPTSLTLSDGDDHQRRRRILQPAFHLRRIAGYLDVMIDETNQVIDQWSPGDTVDAYDQFRLAIRRIVLRCLFGDHLAALDSDLARHLETVLAYVNRPPTQRFDHSLPGLPYRQAVQARRAADAIVYAEIKRRRTERDADDVLGWLLDEANRGDLNDNEVRDQVISLVAAGYDTTAAAMGWVADHLAREPDHAAAIRAEHNVVVGDNRLQIEHLPQLVHTAAFVSEILRHHPPAIWSGRRVVDDFTLHGHTIPTGSMILFSPHVTHHLPDQFPDPDTIKPGRWIEGHPDHHPRHPYAYIPFGGGNRRCLGFAFATQELTVMTSILASRVSFGPGTPHPPRPGGTMSNAPTGGVTLSIQ